LRNIFLTEVLKRGKEICSVHQVHYYKKLLEPFGKAEFPEFPSLILHEAEREWANNFIKAKINKSYSFIIGLNPGSTFGIAKQWLPERFEELARRLISSHNCKIVLFGDSSTSDLAIKINSGLNNMAIDATGKTSVLQLAALIERCDVMITNDTGPMHIACAVGTPVVAVFGSTHPAATSPLGPDSMVIWKEMPCCPCHKRTCPEVHHKCMVEVSVDEVEEAVLKQLKNRANLKFILDSIN
jgi:heptosyltransferase-2